MSAVQTHEERQLVSEALHHSLMELEYVAFEQVMKSLLYRSGYLSVQLIGRNHKRGRTPQGGLDLMARSVTELNSALTLAQIKQYRRVVSRRFVDELRGAMLRLGAEQGLLLTLSTFSKVAHQAARESKLAPVRLIEGPELLELLFAYRIGVLEENGVWRLDHAWLNSLQEKAINTSKRSIARCKNQRKQNSPKSELPYQTAKPTSENETLDSNHISVRNHLSANSAYEKPISKNTGAHLSSSERREMTWNTHVMAGINSLWIMTAIPGLPPENFVLLTGAAALGALLPDLDAAQSKIKHLQIGGIKPFLLPAKAIFHQLGHRSLLHSLLALVYMALAGGILSPFVGWQVALALWLGYASHLAADACTRSGIPLLYPKPRRFHLLPRRLRIVTGSLAEDVLFVLLALGVLLLMLGRLVTLSA